MHLQYVLVLSAIAVCNAKLPRLNQHTQPNELPQNPTQNSQAQRLLQTETKSAKTSRIIDQYRVRHRRDVFDSKSYESSLIWTHSERLDENGDVVLRWVNSDSSITFRLEARTRGYVGLGFNSVRNMRGADLVAAWVDDRNGNAQVLVSFIKITSVILFPRRRLGWPRVCFFIVYIFIRFSYINNTSCFTILIAVALFIISIF